MTAELPEQMQVRRDKLDALRARGVDPYPVGYPRSATLAGLRAAYADLPADTRTGVEVAVTGRVMLNRPAGKLVFATLQEGGDRLQIMLTADFLGAERLADWGRDVDLGDHVGVQGEVVTTRRGELSVRATSWALTAKALRPLPDKYRGLTDPEARVRQRYVDLIVRPEARSMVYARAAVLRSIRETMHRGGFLEVETPVLQPVHGGATARPFRTRLNAFDTDVYLRIAIELYLKRLVVGGLEKVYEIGRNFRNEGVDTTHSPEFTMLEVYEAYGDYNTMATLTRELVLDAAAALGTTTARDWRGNEVDLTAPWRTVTVHEAVSAAVGEEITPDTATDRLRSIAQRCSVSVDPAWNSGDIVLELLEKVVEHTIVEPTFVRDYPVEVRPLARPHRDDPRLAEAWDLFILGVELAPAYSELIDPVEQRRRLTEQSLRAAGGDAEAMRLDEDFLRALEYGLPPLGGLGMGVDRLLMTLTGAGIRDTTLFPLVRPE